MTFAILRLQTKIVFGAFLPKEEQKRNNNKLLPFSIMKLSLLVFKIEFALTSFENAHQREFFYDRPCQA